jgi:biopolymer transport protein ExbD
MMGGATVARRGRRRLRPEASINLTSMLDIMCNLLIVFMLMAPALKHGLNIDVAQTTGGTPVNAEKPMIISIAYAPGDPEVRYYVDTERVTFDQIGQIIEARSNAQPDLAVLIEAAKDVPTEKTLQVLGTIIETGVTNYGFITEPLTAPSGAAAAG